MNLGRSSSDKRVSGVVHFCCSVCVCCPSPTTNAPKQLAPFRRPRPLFIFRLKVRCRRWSIICAQNVMLLLDICCCCGGESSSRATTAEDVALPNPNQIQNFSPKPPAHQRPAAEKQLTPRHQQSVDSRRPHHQILTNPVASFHRRHHHHHELMVCCLC